LIAHLVREGAKDLCVRQSAIDILIQHGVRHFLRGYSASLRKRQDSAPDHSLKKRMELAERQILLETLSATNGVKKLAANLLGIDRRNFSYFLHKHGLQ
jgi:transcriptional regulator with GAF, ATPase, and Fis domain